jgi:two-component system cell cycle response regulator
MLSNPEIQSRAGHDHHRRSHRRRVLKAGKIVLSDWSTIDCTVRDITEAGARLAFAGPTALPTSFWLLVPSDEKLIPAQPAWQKGLVAGVVFTGPERRAPPRKW